MADTLSGSNQLGATLTAGATSFTLNTEAPATTKLTRWCVVDPFTVQAEIRRITAHTGSTVTVAVAFTYSHASGDAVIWLAAPVWDVHLFGAVGNNSTDDTAAIQAAIDDACLSFPAGVVQFGPQQYKITSTLTVDTDGITLRGVSGFGRSFIVGYSATTCLTVNKGSSNITYQVKIENLCISGNSTTATGIKLVNASECTIRDCVIQLCTAKGLWINGSYTGILNVLDVHWNTNPVAIYADAGATLWFTGCNVYSCSTAAIQLTGTVFDFGLRDSWVEDFALGLLVDTTSANADLYSLHLTNCYWLSAQGGGSYTCRIVLATAPNNTYHNIVRNLVMAGNHFYTTAAKYLLEVDWNTYTGSGDNRFWAVLRDNYMHASTNVTSWYTSDVTDTTLTFVRVESASNTSYNGVKLTDSANPTGGGHKFTVGDTTPSVAVAAPFYFTANTAPTTITMFDDGYPGQKITVIVKDPYTTIDFTGTNLYGNLAADWAANNLDWLEAVFDGSKWYCACHKNS